MTSSAFRASSILLIEDDLTTCVARSSSARGELRNRLWVVAGAREDRFHLQIVTPC